MPRKKRQIRADYRRAGFTEEPAKGSHTKYVHPLVPSVYVVAGHDGDDAKPYDERYLAQALHALQEAQRRQQP